MITVLFGAQLLAAGAVIVFTLIYVFASVAEEERRAVSVGIAIIAVLGTGQACRQLAVCRRIFQPHTGPRTVPGLRDPGDRRLLSAVATNATQPPGPARVRGPCHRPGEAL